MPKHNIKNTIVEPKKKIFSISTNQVCADKEWSDIYGIKVRTNKQDEFINITPLIREKVKEKGVKDGL